MRYAKRDHECITEAPSIQSCLLIFGRRLDVCVMPVTKDAYGLILFARDESHETTEAEKSGLILPRYSQREFSPSVL